MDRATQPENRPSAQPGMYAARRLLGSQANEHTCMQAGGTKTYAHLALHMDEELWLVALGARMDKLPHLVRRLVC